jgi:hypothetical protein
MSPCYRAEMETRQRWKKFPAAAPDEGDEAAASDSDPGPEDTVRTNPYIPEIVVPDPDPHPTPPTTAQHATPPADGEPPETPPTDTPFPDLKTLLRESTKKCPITHQNFLPKDALERKEVPRLVGEELNIDFEDDPSMLEKMKKYVSEHAIKGFTTLARRNLRSAIQLFYDAGYKDKQLPLEGAFFTHLAFKNARKKLWQEPDGVQFCMDQWELLAPDFQANSTDGSTDGSTDHRLRVIQVHFNAPLPFTEKASPPSDKGAYSLVHQVKIHPHHHNFPRLVRIPVCSVQLRTRLLSLG